MEGNNNKCCAILFLKRCKQQNTSTTPSICYIRLEQESNVELHEAKNTDKDKDQVHEQLTTMIAKPLEPILKRSCLIEMLYLTTLQKASTENCHNLTNMSSMITVSIHYKKLLDRPSLFLSHILNSDETNVNHLQTCLQPENVHQNNTCFRNGTDLLKDASKKELQNPHCFQKETWMAFFQLITAGGPSTVIDKPHYVYESNSESLFRLLDNLLQDGDRFVSNKLKECSPANLTFTFQQNTQLWRWSATVLLYFILQDILYCRKKWENFDKSNTLCSGSIKASFLLGITKCLGVAILLNWQLVQVIISYFVNPLNSLYKNVHNAISLGIKIAQYFFMLDWIAKDPHFVYNRLKQQFCDLESLLLQAIKELEQETPEIHPYQIDENKPQLKCRKLKQLKYRSQEESQGHFLKTAEELQTLLNQVQQRLSSSPFNWNKALAGKVLLLAFLLDSPSGVLTALTYIMSITNSPFDECPELSWIFGDLSRDVQLYFFQLRLARYLSQFVIQETTPEFYLTKNHSVDKINTFRQEEEINNGNAIYNSNQNTLHNSEGREAHPSSVSWNTTFNRGDYIPSNDMSQNNKLGEHFYNTISRRTNVFDSTNQCQKSSVQVDRNVMPLLSNREQFFSSVGHRNTVLRNNFEKANHQDALRKHMETKKIAEENELYAQQKNSTNISSPQSTNFKLLEQKINKLELALYMNQSLMEEKDMELECSKIVKKKCPTKHRVPNGVKGTLTKVRASTPPPSLNMEKNRDQMTTPAANYVGYNESIYQKLKNYELKMQKAVESLEKRVSQYGSGPEHDVTKTPSKDESEPIRKPKEDIIRKQTASLRSFLAQKAHVERFRKDTLDMLSSDVSQLKKFHGAKTCRQDIERETKKEMGSKTFRKSITGKKFSVQSQPLICNEKFLSTSDEEFDNKTTKTPNQNDHGSSSSNKPQLNIFFKNLGIKMCTTEHIPSNSPQISKESHVKCLTPKNQRDLRNVVSSKQKYLLKEMPLMEKSEGIRSKIDERNSTIMPEKTTISSLKEKRERHEAEKVNMVQKESVNITKLPVQNKSICKEENNKDSALCTSVRKCQESVSPTTTENDSSTKKENDSPSSEENIFPRNDESVLPTDKENDSFSGTENVLPTSNDKNSTKGKDNVLPRNKESDSPKGKENVSLTSKESDSPKGKENVLPTSKDKNSPKGKENVLTRKHVEVLRTNTKTVSSTNLKNGRETNKQGGFEGDVKTFSKNISYCFNQNSKMSYCQNSTHNAMVENICVTNSLESDLMDLSTSISQAGLINANNVLVVSSINGEPVGDVWETKEIDALKDNHIGATDKVVYSKSISLLNGDECVNKTIAQEEKLTPIDQESMSGGTFMGEMCESTEKTRFDTKSVEAQLKSDHINYEKENYNIINEEKIFEEENDGRKILMKKTSCMPVKRDCKSKLLSTKERKVFKVLPFEKLTKKTRVVKTGATIFETTEKKAVKKSITCCVQPKSLLNAKSDDQKDCLNKPKLNLTKTSSIERESFHDIVSKRRKHWVPTMTPEEEACRIEALRLKRNETIQKNSALYLNRYVKQVDALHKISDFSEKPNILFIRADNIKEGTSYSKEKSRFLFNEENTDGMISGEIVSDSQKSEEDQISVHHLFQNEDDALDLYIEKNSFL